MGQNTTLRLVILRVFGSGLENIDTIIQRLGKIQINRNQALGNKCYIEHSSMEGSHKKNFEMGAVRYLDQAIKWRGTEKILFRYAV